MANINELVNGLFTAIDAKDTKSFVSFLSEDAVFAMGEAPVINGKGNIEEGVEQFFQSIKSLSHKVEGVIQEGDRVVTPGVVSYTRHDDSVLTVNFCNVYKFDGDKIKDYNVYIDISQLYK